MCDKITHELIENALFNVEGELYRLKNVLEECAIKELRQDAEEIDSLKGLIEDYECEINDLKAILRTVANECRANETSELANKILEIIKKGISDASLG